MKSSNIQGVEPLFMVSTGGTKERTDAIRHGCFVGTCLRKVVRTIIIFRGRSRRKTVMGLVQMLVDDK